MQNLNEKMQANKKCTAKQLSNLEHKNIPALREKEWMKFKAFGTNGLFKINTTNSGIDAIRLKSGNDRLLPYITRTDNTNGISKFVSEENLSFGYDKANCITVGLDTQTAFYQPHKFITGQNIHIITCNMLNEFSMQFIAPLLQIQMKAKFNWGGNGATLSRMKNLAIKLPVTSSGEPDYKYMKQYAKTMREKKITQYRKYIQDRIEELGDYAEIPSLNEKEWSSFKIGKLFRTNIRGKRTYMPTGALVNKHLLKDGNIPRIRVTTLNNGMNGITNRVNNSNFRTYTNFISMSFLGAAFYHPYEASLDMKVHCLQFLDKEMTVGLGLFITVMLMQNVTGTNYGNQLSSEDLVSKKILLPIDSGKPDFEYMDQYGKNMMLRKYKQYLAFLDAKN